MNSATPPPPPFLIFSRNEVPLERSGGGGGQLSHLLEVSDTVLVGRLQEIIPVGEPSKKTQEVP